MKSSWVKEKNSHLGGCVNTLKKRFWLALEVVTHAQREASGFFAVDACLVSGSTLFPDSQF
jgi:hypothetical protein